MGASTVEDLLVRIRPDGVSETSEELDDMGQQFEETAQQAEDSAGVMENFSEQFQGAMSVVTGGLAIAASGLLSTVPVIGTLASGLFAIIESIGLKIDQVLRPALLPVSDLLFDLANAITNAKGPMGALVGIIGTIATVLGVVVGPLLALIAHFTSWATVIGSLSGILSTVGGAILTVVGILGGPLTVAILAIIAVVTALFVAWKTNFLGIRDIATNVATSIVEGMKQLWSMLQRLFSAGVATLKSAMFNLMVSARAIIDKIQATFSIGFQTMWDMIIASAKQFANSLVNIIVSAANQALSAIPTEIRGKLGLPSSVGVSQPFADQSPGDVFRSGRTRLEQRLEQIEQREQEQRDQNPFADRAQLELIVRPSELEDLFSGNIDTNASNKGE